VVDVSQFLLGAEGTKLDRKIFLGKTVLESTSQQPLVHFTVTNGEMLQQRQVESQDVEALDLIV
jgi:hypothetical protein